jgi:hypothetical protein
MAGPFDPGAYIDAASAVVGVGIDPAWRPGVARFLALAAEMAAVLEAVELDDAELAPAPVYLPPEPPRSTDE